MISRYVARRSFGVPSGFSGTHMMLRREIGTFISKEGGGTMELIYCQEGLVVVLYFE